MALGVFLVALAIWQLFSARLRRRAMLLLIACAFLAAYPISWIVSSWFELGNPLQFARDVRAFSEKSNGFYDFSSQLIMFFIYPKFLIIDHWRALVLPFAGMVLAFLPGCRRARPFVIAWLIFLLFSMSVSSKGGLGSAYRPRYTAFLLLPALCLGAGPIAVFWRATERRRFKLTQLAIGLFLALYMAASGNYARAIYPNAMGFHPGVVGLANRLGRELDGHRHFEDVVWPRRQPLRVFFRDDHWHYWMFMYHTSRGDIIPLWTENQLKIHLDNDADKVRILVQLPRPDIEFPERARLVETIRPYELWEIAINTIRHGGGNGGAPAVRPAIVKEND